MDPDYKIYCHNYNNDKECSFGDSCMYEHDEADKCKFDQVCEGIKYMYRHDDEIKQSDGDGNGSDSDCSEVDINILKPVLEKVKIAVERCDDLMEQFTKLNIRNLS